MPKRFYLSTLPASNPPAISGAWDNTGNVVFRQALFTNEGAFETITTAAASPPAKILIGQFVSHPLAPQTISGDVSGVVLGAEGNAGQNAGSAIAIHVFTSSGTPRGTLLNITTGGGYSSTPNEYTTTLTSRFTPSGVTVNQVTTQRGDYLVFEIGAEQTSSRNNSIDHRYGATGVADVAYNQSSTNQFENPWIEFATNITYEKGAFIYGLAAVRNSVQQSVQGKASVQATTTQTQSAKALIVSRISSHDQYVVKQSFEDNIYDMSLGGQDVFQYRAWPFVNEYATYLKAIGANLKKNGTPGFTLTLSVYTDDGANRPGVLLQTSSTTFSEADIGTSYDWKIFEGFGIQLEKGTKYWLVFQTSGFNGTNNYHVGAGDSPGTTYLWSDNGSFWLSSSGTQVDFRLRTTWGYGIAKIVFGRYGYKAVPRSPNDLDGSVIDYALGDGSGGLNTAGFTTRVNGAWGSPISSYILHGAAVRLYKVGAPSFDVTIAIWTGSSTPDTLLTTIATFPASDLSSVADSVHYVEALQNIVLQPDDNTWFVVSVSAQGDTSNYIALGQLLFVEGSGTFYADAGSPSSWISYDFAGDVRFNLFQRGMSGKANITPYVSPSVSFTQSGLARIQASISQTQNAIGNIRTTTSFLQSSVARVQATNSSLQTGRGRIQSSVLQLQTGVARIRASIIQFQSGLSRIALSSEVISTGKARVQSQITQVQSGLSNIRNSNSQVIFGLGNISAQSSHTVIGQARIQTNNQYLISGQASIAALCNRAQVAWARLVSSWGWSAFTQSGKAYIVVEGMTKTYSVFGIARIRATTTQTQMGVARIRTTTTQAQTGIARIRTATTQAQTGIARIRTVTTQAQTGIARIRATTTNTQTGIARIRSTTTETQTGVARIRTTTTQTQIGIARIQKSFIYQQFGQAWIRTSNPQAILGLARIQTTSIRVQAGKSFIRQSGQEKISGTARIKTTNTYLQIGQGSIYIRNIAVIFGISRLQISVVNQQSGISRIKATAINTQTGIARIRSATTQTQVGVARIRISTSQAQTGVARIRTTTTQTQVGVARIRASISQTQMGIARIQTTATQTQMGIARIRATATQTQMGVARIRGINVQTQTGVAKIRVNNILFGLARISQTLVYVQSGKGFISVSGQEKIFGVARIQTTEAQEQTGVARIQTTATEVQTGVGRIRATVTQAQTAIARIQATNTWVQTGVARVQTTNARLQIGQAHIHVGNIYTIYGKGFITTLSTTTTQQIGIARIQAQTLQSQVGLGRVQITNNNAISGQARLLVRGSVVINGLARIAATDIYTNTGLARIASTKTDVIYGISRIYVQNTNSIVGRAYITNSVRVSISGKASIGAGISYTISGKGRVVRHAPRCDKKHVNVVADNTLSTAGATVESCLPTVAAEVPTTPTKATTSVRGCPVIVLATIENDQGIRNA